MVFDVVMTSILHLIGANAISWWWFARRITAETSSINVWVDIYVIQAPAELIDRRGRPDIAQLGEGIIFASR